MFRLFEASVSFNQNVGGWNVASVTSLTNTFNAAHPFDHDISRCVEPQRLNSVGRGNLDQRVEPQRLNSVGRGNLLFIVGLLSSGSLFR
jgi:hypothetical protein